jgi:phosphate transport system protein
LERVGDEAARVARTVDKLVTAGMSTRLHQPVADLAYAAELATASLRKALDAFARLDTARAGGAQAGRPDRLVQHPANKFLI